MLASLRRFALWLALAATAACSTAPQTSVGAAQQSNAVFPDTGWTRVAPATAGFSRVRLDSAAAYLATLKTTGAVVVVGGRLLLDYGNLTELRRSTWSSPTRPSRGRDGAFRAPTTCASWTG